jgi:hypothetical protein
VAHCALGTSPGLLRTWLQLRQFSGGADAGCGTAELGVGPASYPGVALVTGVQTTAAAIDATKESSAQYSRPMRHMAVNGCMRRPQAVIPLVTPWSRYLPRGLDDSIPKRTRGLY